MNEGEGMNNGSDGELDEGEIYLDDNDIIGEINVDEEDIPDFGDDNEAGYDVDEIDNSIHLFTGHKGELYTVASSPADALLVATGGGDDKGFLWKIGQGDWAQEIPERKDC